MVKLTFVELVKKLPRPKIEEMFAGPFKNDAEISCMASYIKKNYTESEILKGIESFLESLLPKTNEILLDAEWVEG